MIAGAGALEVVAAVVAVAAGCGVRAVGCGSAGARRLRATMGGGGIFTGNINLLCTSNMMIAMVLFACVSVGRVLAAIARRLALTDTLARLLWSRSFSSFAAPSWNTWCAVSLPPPPVPAPPSRFRRVCGLDSLGLAQLHGNKGHMEMLTKFYKELMILGARPCRACPAPPRTSTGSASDLATMTSHVRPPAQASSRSRWRCRASSEYACRRRTSTASTSRTCCSHAACYGACTPALGSARTRA